MINLKEKKRIILILFFECITNNHNSNSIYQTFKIVFDCASVCQNSL